MLFSVLMSVYHKDSPNDFEEALNSLVSSVVRPDEVVLVEDGPLGDDLQSVISSFSDKLPFRNVKLASNVGLGKALSIGLRECSHEWVARFDSDDICHPARFKTQIAFIQQRQHIDIIGTAIAEFESSKADIHAYRKPPINHDEIVEYAKSRNPFNHMTVMYRKSKVLEAGSYQDNYLYEDYALWVRMINNGAITANIPEILVYARTGNGMEIRRGGFKYACSEISAQLDFYNSGFINKLQLCKNLLVRVPVRLLPGGLRKSVYRNFLRK
ncbi:MULTISPECIES: glycosyltransferase [Aeromonas]|uniref:glycosyltransferase n=3 Tax=Aeromonadaceae TaxID=84642 RepID=UPI001CC72F62|nr:glycosyltransferase [Aeromonas caviae]GJA34487.1 putative glycosyltransferase [Aeromonas caviae]GJA38898.1 putative glycosyltransferase [Aeromonas caviae]GJA52392.1 putative glycosyltransferase [Aeromonas caviae]GJA61203.1 putative glycosyltransferase [Aeromonas caviae]GJA70199.1 putative glycosyltransferase [Aeromonas caviae]